MEAALALVVGAWSWVDETLRSVAENHPFWCLFIGILYLVMQLERSILSRLKMLSDEVTALRNEIAILELRD